jgi:hypothetical protein
MPKNVGYPKANQGNPGKVGGGGGVDKQGHPAAPPANAGEKIEGTIRESTKRKVPNTR